jgi:hypothetical protein
MRWGLYGDTTTGRHASLYGEVFSRLAHPNVNPLWNRFVEQCNLRKASKSAKPAWIAGFKITWGG